MDTMWLVRQVNFDEAVALFGKHPDSDWRWQMLFDAFTDGDELWEYNKPREFWSCQGGQTGIVLLRYGQAIDKVVTKIS